MLDYTYFMALLLFPDLIEAIQSSYVALVQRKIQANWCVGIIFVDKFDSLYLFNIALVLNTTFYDRF